MNFYPFHIGDYISHTSHLSDEEDLAYRRMIDLYYLNEKPFPDDFCWIARRVKADSLIVENLLNEFFEFGEDALWHNPRADKEIAKYQFLSESGKKGAEKRWANREEKPSQCTPNSPPNATPIATKTKTNTITNKKHIQPEGFDLFWDAYDKKVGKPNSLKAWSKIVFKDDLLQKIVEKARADKKAKPDNKFRKDPERWLKGQHWLDEVVIEQAPKDKYLPLGTEKQIEEAYRVECGGDPTQARFNSYFDMKKFILEQRDKRSRA